MSACVPTHQRLGSGVALALRSADVTTSQNTLPNATDHDEPSSDAEHATDEASEPQPGGHLKSTTNKRKRGDDEPRPEEEERPVHVAAWQVSRSGAESTPSPLLGHDGGPSSEDAESTLSTSLTLVDHDEHHGNPAPSATAVSDGQGREPMGPNPDEGATSDLGDDWDAGSTVSLDSATLDFVKENGREFHAKTDNGYKYWMPNDEKQDEALNIRHDAYWYLHEERLHLAPIGNDVQDVLDVGTGTGAWALEFADKYPSAHVIGIDISPHPPQDVAPNSEFQIDDCNEESTFGADRFDYIHVRDMNGCLSDCRSFAERQFRDLKPGGFLECKEQSMCFESDHECLKGNRNCKAWQDFYKEVESKLERSLTNLEDGKMKAAMERAGFTNIKTIKVKMPVGSWPKDERLKQTGRLNLAALLSDLEGLVLRPARLIGWEDQEVTVLKAFVRDLLSQGLNLWRWVTVVYGQKPE